jgi:hypothetical protein
MKDDKLVAGLFDAAYAVAQPVLGDRARIDGLWRRTPPTPLNGEKNKGKQE